MGRRHHEKTSSDSDDSASDPRQQRHHNLFLGLVGSTAFLDVVLAIYMGVNTGGMAAYVWVTALGLSLCKALYVGGASWYVTRKLRKTDVSSHKDLVVYMIPLWTGSLVADVMYSFGSGSLVGSILTAIDNAVTLTFIIMAIKLHLLSRAKKGDSLLQDDKKGANSDGDATSDDSTGGGKGKTGKKHDDDSDDDGASSDK